MSKQRYEFMFFCDNHYTIDAMSKRIFDLQFPDNEIKNKKASNENISKIYDILKKNNYCYSTESNIYQVKNDDFRYIFKIIYWKEEPEDNLNKYIQEISDRQNDLYELFMSYLKGKENFDEKNKLISDK